MSIKENLAVALFMSLVFVVVQIAATPFVDFDYHATVGFVIGVFSIALASADYTVH